MIKNTVTASVEFHYKGQLFTPSLELELDRHMQSNDRLPDLYQLIATANNIDLYSYEYEIMQTGTIRLSNASGLVSDYIRNGLLDIKAFEAAWRENRILSDLQVIAKRHLGISDLQENPELKKALTEAYHLNREDKA